MNIRNTEDASFLGEIGRGRYWCVVVLVFEVEDEEVAVLVL